MTRLICLLLLVLLVAHGAQPHPKRPLARRPVLHLRVWAWRPVGRLGIRVEVCWVR